MNSGATPSNTYGSPEVSPAKFKVSPTRNKDSSMSNTMSSGRKEKSPGFKKSPKLSGILNRKMPAILYQDSFCIDKLAIIKDDSNPTTGNHSPDLIKAKDNLALKRSTTLHFGKIKKTSDIHLKVPEEEV
jgi:hypothetical protein